MIVVSTAAVGSGCKKKSSSHAKATAREKANQETERKTEEEKAAEGSAESAAVSNRRYPIARTWVVPDVRLELVSVNGDELDIDSVALAQRLGAGLRASRFFVDDERKTPHGREFAPATVAARVGYQVIEDASLEQPSIIVTAEVVVLPDSGVEGPIDLATHDNVIIEQPLLGHEKKKKQRLVKQVSAQLNQAIDLTIQGLIEKERLRVAPARELGEVVARGVELSFWALELIAEYRYHRVIDVVVSALQSPNQELADMAITTLVALGEPSSVNALTQLADFQDYQRLRVIIEAVSALGGDDAIEFLDFVSTGHPDSDIKARALEALAELDGRHKSQ